MSDRFVRFRMIFMLLPILIGEIPLTFGSSPIEFSTLLTNTEQPTRTISSDQEALTAISPFLDWKPARTVVSPRIPKKPTLKSDIPDDLAILGIEFTKQASVFHWARKWEETITQRSILASLETLEKQQPFLNWVKANPPHPEVTNLISLLRTFLELSSRPQTNHDARDGYREFAQHLLQTYPDWSGLESSWLKVAEHQGSSGILHRIESNGKFDTAPHPPLSSNSEGKMTAFMHRFLHQEVLPHFKSHLEVALYSLWTKSEHRAWKTWQQILRWNTQQQEWEGLTRLCGTWQWLIHNHQNHGDHKTLMIYPPPSQYDRMKPKPSKIQVQGDTLYIRWEFPRGIVQEESLLFSEKDRMLSGTFENNMGPNGNITARRMAPCQKN